MSDVDMSNSWVHTLRSMKTRVTAKVLKNDKSQSHGMDKSMHFAKRSLLTTSRNKFHKVVL